MKKYIFKRTGREVKLGDKLIKVIPVFGIPFPVDEITIDESTLQDLIASGIVIVREDEITVEDITKHLAARIKWNHENLIKYLENLDKMNPSAVFSTILRELAIMLDEKYPGHISECSTVWCINSIDGNICSVSIDKVKSYNTFAMFRTEQDAQLARKILEVPLKEFYGK